MTKPKICSLEIVDCIIRGQNNIGIQSIKLTMEFSLSFSANVRGGHCIINLPSLHIDLFNELVELY